MARGERIAMNRRRFMVGAAGGTFAMVAGMPDFLSPRTAAAATAARKP